MKYYNSVHDIRSYEYIGYNEPEIWKPIINDFGKNSKYEVSNFGHVRKHGSKKYLKHTWKKNDNHHTISLRLNGLPKEKAKRFYVHRLVAEAFIPNPENKPQVHHKDGDPNYNYYKNLMWVTPSEHLALSYELEQRDRKFGDKSPNAKYTNEQYELLVKLLNENKLKVKELSEKTKISVSAILSFIRGEVIWPEARKNYDIEKYDKIQKIKKSKMEKVFQMISENKYTIGEISEKTGISRSTISELINGKVSEKWKYLLEKYDLSSFDNFENVKNHKYNLKSGHNFNDYRKTQ